MEIIVIDIGTESGSRRSRQGGEPRPEDVLRCQGTQPTLQLRRHVQP